MPGLARRLFPVVRKGRIDLAGIADLAARVGPADPGLPGPARELAREMIAARIKTERASRVMLVGAGRLATEDALPVSARVLPIGQVRAATTFEPGFDLLVIGDALAAEDDPATTLAQIAAALECHPCATVMLVLPGTAMLPDDDPPCPRRWLFSPISAHALGRRAFPAHELAITARGNVLAAAGELLGLAASELWPAELAANDVEYPMVIAMVASRSGAQGR